MRTLWTLGVLLLGHVAVAAEPVDYLRDVKPLLRARCWACHGALHQKANLRLDTAAFVRKGGRHGPAVAPGKDADSLLLHAVLGNGRPRMPPEGEGEALSTPQVALLRAWIEQGARGPTDEPPEPDPRQHWAFQPPTRPPVPAVRNTAWVRNPVDAFLAAEHERRGLMPAEPAARATLLRRVHLDLIGLPPTPAELHRFLEDDSPDAYERVVERLLASPQYGERWGRHWMDVWRYSDWYGRRAVPDVWNSAPQIWRWRDWIVASLNADNGYDRMTREMLAADELSPEDDANVVATGYLVRSWYALNPNQWMRELVEHTGKAFLGLTFQCAHCHDHKYDPIRQEEYFRFRAFFEPLQLRQDRVPGEPDPGPFQKYEYTKLRKVMPFGLVRVFDENLDAKTHVYRGGDERERVEGKPPVAPGVPAFLSSFGGSLPIEPVTLSPRARHPGLKAFIHAEEYVRHDRAAAEAETALRKIRADLAAAAQRLAGGGQVSADEKAQALTALRAAPAALERAEARRASAEAERDALQARLWADRARFGLEDLDPEVAAYAAGAAERRTALLLALEKALQAEHALSAGRGKPEPAAALTRLEQQLAAAKQAVAAAEKSVAAPSTAYTPLSATYPATSTGRRKALALWLTRRENPLTARVAVNHVWLRHFDWPLVETVQDFGRNGKPPTHPALLDWLAIEFMDSGWSLKHLHHLLVTSNAYRMASHFTQPGGAKADPDNRWYWRFNPRRVEAEVVRDSLLHCAGQLDPRLGGPPLENKDETAPRRRSLYFSVYPEDGGHPRFLELFDAPDPTECYRRTTSIVPQQALVLTNSDLTHTQARGLARQLTEATASESALVRAAFEHVLCRPPTPVEEQACVAFLARQRASIPAGTPAAEIPQRLAASLLRVLFSHHEFVTIR